MGDFRTRTGHVARVQFPQGVPMTSQLSEQMGLLQKQRAIKAVLLTEFFQQGERRFGLAFALIFSREPEALGRKRTARIGHGFLQQAADEGKELRFEARLPGQGEQGGEKRVAFLAQITHGSKEGRGQIGAELGVPTLPGLPSACRNIALAGHRCVDNGLHEIPVTATSDRTLHRATAKLFGRTSAPFSGGQLYPITSDEIPIPGGSRLETNNEDTPFIGSVGLSGDGMSLLTQVTVEADSLRVYRVGRTEQAEVLATGAIARAIGDPSLWPLLILTAIIAYLLQLAINLRGIFKDAAGEK